MTVVSGNITIVTETPALITEVRVHAPENRTFGDGVMTTLSAPVSYSPQSGEVLFNAAPGPAVLSLKAGSRPLGSLPLVVPDGDTATLRQCVEAAMLADEGTINALERLALEVADKVATITNITMLEEWADSAKQDATTAQEIATNLPATIQTELDTRVPPEVAEALSTDQTIRDAATLAVNDAVDAGLPGKADTTYVDQQDQALGRRIDNEKWWQGALGSAHSLDDLRGRAAQGMYQVNTVVGGGPGLGGWVEITYDSNSARTRQIFSPSSPTDSMSLERKYSGGSWSAWKPAHWRGAPITSGTIDTVTTPGQFAVTSSNVSGIPVLSPGSLEVLEGGSGASSLLQRFVSSSPTPSAWVRPRSGSGWGAWVHVGGHARHILSSGDLNSETRPGMLNVTSSLVANLPVAVVGAVEILPASGGIVQRFTSGEEEPRTFVRHLPSGGTWSAWRQIMGQAGEGEEAGDRPHPVTYNPAETIKSSGYIPYAVSADGMTSWNYNSHELRESFDGGHTWQAVRTFGGQSIEFVEELANGELIVATTGTVDGVGYMRRVWVSTGYDTTDPSAASWEVKITGSAPMVKFVDWCFYQHNNILLMNEYGPKSGYTWAGGSSIIEEGQNARYTWMSEDYGQTWARIFDLNEWLLDNGRPNADGQHLHGVAWDKHWDRIWITFGDNLGGTATNGIIYSDDKGATWEAAHWTGTAESVGQVVGIQPMKDCIVFAGDMTPSGYLRIDREGGKDRTEWDVTTAWTFSDTDLHLCHSIIHREFPQGGEVTLMGFSQEGTNSPSFIIATRDGYDTDLIWVDEQNRSLGLRTMAGPTDRGELIAAISTGAGTVELRGVLDIFGTDWSTVYGLQDRMAELETLAGEKADKDHVHTTAEITGLHHYSGTGFPEGKVTAPVGATYVDTAATNGALRWIKTQGTGNTGWQVEYGDTGWRDVSSSIEDRMSPLEFTDGAKLLVRRIGALAYLKISGQVYVRNQFGKLCDSFNGFRPESFTQFNLSKAADINSGVYQIRVESGTVDGSVTSGATRSIMGYWDVAQSWPSTLPGSPS